MLSVSAWPVSPVRMSCYSGLFCNPREYPDGALIPPFTCWKTAWIPQKQPPATTAVCSDLLVAMEASTIGLGIDVLGRSPAQAIMLANNTVTKRVEQRDNKDIPISWRPHQLRAAPLLESGW